MALLRTFKVFAVLGLAATFGLTHAQYTFSNISLYKNFTLAELSAGGGNSCWGYVSPSGREYALMGCNNKVAFVEITDPNNPVYFASIPHAANLWGDIKTYGSVAYAVTELSASGLQVIDLSNIDNHQVTLLRTLTSPGRSHTIHVDTASGFLYCCGTHEGTGTTMCFDLKPDPKNPVRVGMNSLTGTNYQHETIVVPYTSGPYAGKTIMFSGGEGRGVEIWDATDKNVVTLMKRISYPFVGYCHQSWLSPDRKFLYVNDEFDESNQNFNTRTLVFDVSVIATADLVATFSTNKTSIDHNLYNKNNFVFESNYTTGLNIFDANQNPTAPTYRGFFDTYPSDDSKNYAGLWSNYPFFPSGTVIGSDMNRGLFIFDVSEATKTNFAVGNVLNVRGKVISGGLTELTTQDGNYYVVGKGLTVNVFQAPIEQVFEGTSLWSDVSRLKFNLRIKASTAGLEQTIELYDWTSNTWVEASTAPVPTADTTFTVTGPNPDRFVDPVAKRIKARVVVRQTGPTAMAAWSCSMDLANWTVNP